MSNPIAQRPGASLALLNAGNAMLGLAPLSLPPPPPPPVQQQPQLLNSAPLRQPMAGSAVVPSTTTAPPPPHAIGHTNLGTKIAATALTQLGTPYQWGGQAKLGGHTDCSGLLQASAAANGVHIGRTTYQQWAQGIPVARNQLKAGDAVFFHMSGRGPEHVGIYIGGGRFVEDPHTGSSVRIEDLASYGGYVGARRFA